MMIVFLKTKHNQGVHGSVTLALTRPDPLILVTSVWLEHAGNLSGAYSHVSPISNSDLIMKCLKWWGRRLCWLTRDGSCNLHFISRDAPTHGLMPIKGFPVAGSGHGHVCVCALSSRQTSSETRRAEIRESQLTWDAGQHLKRALWQSPCCLATSNHNNYSVSQLPGLRLYPGVSYLLPSPHSTRWCTYLSTCVCCTPSQTPHIILSLSDMTHLCVDVICYQYWLGPGGFK